MHITFYEVQIVNEYIVNCVIKLMETCQYLRIYLTMKGARITVLVFSTDMTIKTTWKFLRMCVKISHWFRCGTRGQLGLSLFLTVIP